MSARPPDLATATAAQPEVAAKMEAEAAGADIVLGPGATVRVRPGSLDSLDVLKELEGQPGGRRRV